MNTISKISKSTIAVFCIVFISGLTNAQFNWDSDGNLVTGSSPFIGATSTSTTALRIKNEATQPIEFYTDGNLRFTIGSSGNFSFGSGNAIMPAIKYNNLMV